MERMTLHLDEPIISDTGISGIFYVTVGSTDFPETGWFDMISVNLERWVPVLTSFAMNHTDSCKLGFMDGPCCIKLSRIDGCVYISCFWEQKEVIAQTPIDLNGFLRSVIKCVGQYHWWLQKQSLKNELRLLKDCIDIGENHV